MLMTTTYKLPNTKVIFEHNLRGPLLKDIQ